MASVATRNSVRDYELRQNSLINAFQPGGILYFAVEHGPLEAVLVPREIALSTCGLAPFLRVRSALTAPSSPADDGANRTFQAAPAEKQAGNGAPAAAAARQPCVTPSGSGAKAAHLMTAEEHELEERLQSLNAAQHRCITTLLKRFLTHHLIHFRNSGTLAFSNAAGEQGKFSDSLDEIISLSWKSAAMSVVVEADAMRPAHDRAVAQYHPLHLSIFFIDTVFLSPAALKNTLWCLRHVLLLDAPRIVVQSDGQLDVVPEESVPSPRAAAPAAKPKSPAPQAAATAAAAATPAAAAAITGAVRDTNGKAEHQEEEQEAEASTVFSEVSDDVVVECDELNSYSTKARQRQEEALQLESQRSAQYSAAARRMLCEQDRQRQQQEPLQQGKQRLSPRNDGDGASAAGTKEKATPTPTPTPTPAPAPPSHINVKTHDYSKSSILDYRKAVAPDNFIHYSDFETMMAKPYCLPIARLISQFMGSPTMQNPKIVFQDNRVYCSLINTCLEEVQRIPNIANSTHATTVIAEGIERYLTSKLYYRMFDTVPEEARLNRLLEQKLTRVAQLTAADLDALEEVQSHHVWGQAMFELDGMNFFKTPREKLRCGMRASELLSLAVSDILRARRAKREGAAAAPPPAASAPTFAFGADEFIPCFMLLVLRARPNKFYQNVHFIERYRTPTLCTPEECYCLANMLSAIEFWLNCDDKGRMPTPPHEDSSALSLATRSSAAAAAPSSAGATAAGAAASSASRAGDGSPSASRRFVRVPPPPVVQATNCLPSVKSALKPDAAARSPTLAAAPTPAAAGLAGHLPATGVLDALFGWSGRSAPAPAAAAAAAAPAPVKGVVLDPAVDRLDDDYEALRQAIPVALPAEGKGELPFTNLFTAIRNTLSGGAATSAATAPAPAPSAGAAAAAVAAAQAPERSPVLQHSPTPSLDELFRPRTETDGQRVLAERIPRSYELLCLEKRTFGTLSDKELRSIIEELQGAFSA